MIKNVTKASTKNLLKSMKALLFPTSVKREDGAWISGGWKDRRWSDEDEKMVTCYCLTGAAGEVVNGNPGMYVELVERPTQKALNRVYDALIEAGMHKEDFLSKNGAVVNWNDHELRTAQEVRDLLDRAIQNA